MKKIVLYEVAAKFDGDCRCLIAIPVDDLAVGFSSAYSATDERERQACIKQMSDYWTEKGYEVDASKVSAK